VGPALVNETLIKRASHMVRQGSPEFIEGLTTNGIKMLPFVLSVVEGSLSKDLVRTSLT
jgi:hypothetical protein